MALSQGQQAIEGPNARLQHLGRSLALQGPDGRAVQVGVAVRPDGTSAIDRRGQGVNGPTQKSVADGHTVGLRAGDDTGAQVGREPRAQRSQYDRVALDAGDLRQDGRRTDLTGRRPRFHRAQGVDRQAGAVGFDVGRQDLGDPACTRDQIDRPQPLDEGVLGHDAPSRSTRPRRVASRRDHC